MEAYYYHKEIMEQRGLKTQDLPENLRSYVVKFNQKKRFTKDPEKIAELQEFSQILGEKIAETQIKKKSTINDLRNELENETVEAITQNVNEMAEEFEQGGEITPEIEKPPIEEEIIEDLPEPTELENIHESHVSDTIKKVSEIKKENTTETPKEESESDWGVLNFLKW